MNSALAKRVLFAVGLWGCCFGTVLARDSGRADIKLIPDKDKGMAAAKAKAKKTVDQFLKKAANPEKGSHLYTVKLLFKDSHGEEFMWLSPFRKRPTASGYEGILVSRPGKVRYVKKGSLVRFSKKDIVDWGYLKNKQWFGQYTTCALFPHMSPEEVMAFRKQGYVCKD